MHVQLIKDLICIIWRDSDLHINNSLYSICNIEKSHNMSGLVFLLYFSAFWLHFKQKDVCVHLDGLSINLPCVAWLKLISFFYDLRALDKNKKKLKYPFGFGLACTKTPDTILYNALVY